MQRARRFLFLAVLVVFASAHATGCTIRVRPPANPIDPTDVYLIDHGRHASLLLPTDDNDLIEYAYGEWKWFANDDTGPVEAVSTLFLPTTGTLGRGLWPIPPSLDAVQATYPGTRVHQFRVAQADAHALAARLNVRFEASIDTRVEQPIYRMAFVHDEADYHLLHSCNDVTSAWLRDLGCEVRGSAIIAEYRFITPVD